MSGAADMRTITFIRHGFTAGNLSNRYVGRRTDEELSEKGIILLQENSARDMYPQADAVFCGTMARCRQTASILYPEQTAVPIAGLTEMDFGDFEGKNFSELDGNPDFQAYIDSGGTTRFPGGEDRAAFIDRTMAAWKKFLDAFLKTAPAELAVSVIVNSGTLMAVASETASPKRDYFDWHLSPGGGKKFFLMGDEKLTYIKDI